MQQKELNIIYHELAFDELSVLQQSLITQAKTATKQAYAPYSEFYVGCALQLQTGETITGSNQENAAYPSGLCAERTAIFYAGHSHPHSIISCIAIAARSEKWNTKNPVIPCGACLQAMIEYERKQASPIQVLLYGSDAKIFQISGIKDLMPFQFELKI